MVVSDKKTGVSYRAGAVHECRPEWSWSPKNMPDFDLWLVTGGVGELTYADGDRFELRRGVCFLFAPGDSLTAHHQPTMPLKVLAVHFQCLDRKRTLMAHEIAENKRLRISNLNLLESMLRRSIQAGRLSNKRDAEVWLEATLIELHSEAVGANRNLQLCNGRLDKLCAEVLAHPEAAWSVTQMARQCHLCVDHFIRVFQRHMGMTPKAFVVHSRIDRACNLLLSSDMNIGEIAAATGFSNVYYFSRLFKQQIGCPPSKYR